MDKQKLGFADVVDELKWGAVKLSGGHVEAVSQFVKNRNLIREKEESAKMTTEKAKDAGRNL